MDSLIQLTVAGLVTGMIYALIGASYAVIYTATGFVNFALGAQAMVAGYVVYVFIQDTPLLLRITASVLFSVLLSVLSWNHIYRRIARRDMLSATIASFGFSIVVQEAVRIIAGNAPLPAKSPFGTAVHHWGAVTISSHNVAVLLIGTAMSTALILAFRSRRGASVRAMFQDVEMAETIGIRTDRMTAILFAVAGIFMAAAGIMIGPLLSMSPTMGTRLALIAFVGAILGGLGKISTAVAGGIVLGLLEAAFAGYVSADYRITLVFTVFIAVLISRPAGIFGAVAKLKV